MEVKVKVKEISVQFSFTKNLGNYESAKASAGMVVTLKKEDDYKEAFDEAFRAVREEVSEQMMKMLETKYNK